MDSAFLDYEKIEKAIATSPSRPWPALYIPSRIRESAAALSTALPQGVAGLRTMAILLGCAILVNVISVPFMSFLTRSLGTEGFGTYSIASAFAFFASIVVDIGASSLIIREMVGRTDRATTIISGFMAPKLPLAVLCALGGAAIGAAIGYSGATLTSVVIGTVAGAFMALAAATRAIFHAHQRMEFDVVGVLGERVGTVACACVALALGMGVVGVMLATVAGNVLDLGLSWALVRARFVPQLIVGEALSPRNLAATGQAHLSKSYVRMGAGLLVAGLSIQLYQRCQTLVIGATLGRGPAGLFAAAFALFSLVALVSTSVGLLTFPQVSRVAWEKGHGALAGLGKRMTVAVGALGLLLGLALALSADSIVGTLYSPDFRVSASLVKVLAMGMPFLFMSGQLCQILIASGRQGVVGRSTAIAAAFNIGANLLITPLFGLHGAAWVQVCTDALLATQCGIAVWRR